MAQNAENAFESVSANSGQAENSGQALNANANVNEFANIFENVNQGSAPVNQGSAPVNQSQNSASLDESPVANAAAAPAPGPPNIQGNVSAESSESPDANASSEANASPAVNQQSVAQNENSLPSATPERNLTPPQESTTTAQQAPAQEAPSLQPVGNYQNVPLTQPLPLPLPLPVPQAPGPKRNTRKHHRRQTGYTGPAPRRTTRQREADAGQRQMMDTLREIYNKEFADIPEKYRPKPKVYVARAAFYKPAGQERDAYIQQWVEADRNAARARQGLTAPRAYPKRLPALVSIASTRKIKFDGMADPLREQAKRAETKIREIADKTEERLLKHAVDSEGRKAAKTLGHETRKVGQKLSEETHRQATALEKAARQRVGIEARRAFDEIEKRALANLTVARSGVRPPKRLTRKLARVRNSGRAVSANQFLQNLTSKGKYSPPKTRSKSKSRSPGSAQVNANNTTGPLVVNNTTGPSNLSPSIANSSSSPDSASI